MGYQVSSIFSVAPDDGHAFFIYFIPANQYKYLHLDWINNYFSNNFQKLASSFGEKSSVIITPTQNRAEKYIEEIAGINSGGCLFSQYEMFPEDNFKFEDPSVYLHSGEPYLIISNFPIHGRKNDESSGLIINIHKVKDEPTLGSVIDAIINGIKLGSLDSIVENLPEWERSYNKNDLSDYTSMLELKPNIFGVGVNLNAVLNYISKKFVQKYNKENSTE